MRPGTLRAGVIKRWARREKSLYLPSHCFTSSPSQILVSRFEIFSSNISLLNLFIDMILNMERCLKSVCMKYCSKSFSSSIRSIIVTQSSSSLLTIRSHLSWKAFCSRDKFRAHFSQSSDSIKHRGIAAWEGCRKEGLSSSQMESCTALLPSSWNLWFVSWTRNWNRRRQSTSVKIRSFCPHGLVSLKFKRLHCHSRLLLQIHRSSSNNSRILNSGYWGRTGRGLSWPQSSSHWVPRWL